MLFFGENKKIDFRESVGFPFLSFLPFFFSLIYQLLVHCFLSLFIKVTNSWSIDAQHFFDLRVATLLSVKKMRSKSMKDFPRVGQE